MDKRPPTPDPIKRQLRQESYFGCCVCGNSIIQYHHIIPWEIENHFRAEDMMCLCPNHHDEATKGAILEHDQREYKLKPFNIKKSHANGKLTINHNLPIIKVGDCLFVGDGDFISVDNKSLLSLDAEGGCLLISIKLFDKEDNLKAEIVDNEWITGNPKPWDIISSYQYLKVWHKKREIGLEIDTSKYPINILAKLNYNKQEFILNNNGMFFNGVIKDLTFQNLSFVGMNFVADINNKVFQIRPNRRFGKGVIIAGTNINEGIESWEKLNSNTV